MQTALTAERQRLAESESRQKHWKRWGPYLADRAWGTVREDYSDDGRAWEYFPHDHARSRAYRWTEDGILGICDNHQYICFAFAFWNGKDAILKERLYGLTGNQGNHGEDVKELYYYIESTPTHSYMKGLYKYPQAAFPYAQIEHETAKRNRMDDEYEIECTGVFDENRYFDIYVEYAKQDVDDIFMRLRALNRGPQKAPLTILPTIWFRDTWTWADNKTDKPVLGPSDGGAGIRASQCHLGEFKLDLEGSPQLLFTGNETNTERLYGTVGENRFYKDAFHEYLINGKHDAVNPQLTGTKGCGVYQVELEANQQCILHFRLSRAGSPNVNWQDVDKIFDQRIAESSEFYDRLCSGLQQEARHVQRQAFAGLFWSKQYYHFVVDTWLNGDPAMPKPPERRKYGRDSTWRHLFNEDVISMPDKWEYPWYAAWDLAFHTVAIAPADPDLAKEQLALFLREWYMHPNGQIPAYEWAFGDVNPPVHAWAAWRVYQIDEKIKGRPDVAFLEGVFHKLLMNFTWWVNRKDSEGNNIFEGGFLGLDNIGIFDRSAPLPSGWLLEQSDGSSWMGMYCLNMLKIALQLSTFNKVYEDIASKFFEHFLYIADAVNHSDGTGLWDEEDGFYYDRLRTGDGVRRRLRVRSMVGLVPLFACDTFEIDLINQHEGFKKRMQWFVDNRPDLTAGIAPINMGGVSQRRLLSIVTKERLERILARLFDESEFLSPYGIRSLSRYHKDHPYQLDLDGAHFAIGYEPAESRTGTFGGNSNWRGPIWFPMNFLLIEALQRLNHYYGDSFNVVFPGGSDNCVSLATAAKLLSQRLCSIFLPDSTGNRPVYGKTGLFQQTPGFKNYVLFYEYFNGDDGRGLGASHQTGWTGLVAKLLQQSGVGMAEYGPVEPELEYTA